MVFEVKLALTRICVDQNGVTVEQVMNIVDRAALLDLVLVEMEIQVQGMDPSLLMQYSPVLLIPLMREHEQIVLVV